MPIIDTHCHYNLEPLFADWGKHWQKAQEHGIEKSIVVGTNFETSIDALHIAEKEANLFATIGIHPYNFAEPESIKLIQKNNFEECLRKLDVEMETFETVDGDEIVAIGEVGLDYFHLKQEKNVSDDVKAKVKELQQIAFKKHIAMAQERHLPLILHVRDQNDEAYWDVMKCLKEEKFDGRFILHCVSGPEAYVKEALEMGAYIGVAGNVTYKSADHIRSLVQMAPKERILLETDAPYLPPQEYRGQVCEPWMISLTGKFLEEEMRISLNQILENTLQLFPQLGHD